jgi:hypothetical protein
MLGRLVLATLAALAILALAAGATYADIKSVPRMAIEDAVTPHATGGATGACSIVYYNLCRWLYLYGFHQGDEAGVLFDLPLDCGKQAGETCMNTGFWWYWRFTAPNRTFIDYSLYGVDAQGCKQGTPLGTLTHMSPTERWNHYPGLGGPFAFDRVAIIVSYDGALAMPRVTTDNNVTNMGDPTNCPGYVPHTVGHSVFWRYQGNTYCPPVGFADALGPVELIMEASFSCEPVATEDESWSGVKRLFR